MKHILVWGGVVLAVLLSGCAATSSVSSNEHLYTDNQEAVGGAAIKTQNLVANLDIEGKRVTQKARGGDGVSVAFIRRTLLSAALLKGGADIIGDPVFHIVLKPRGYEATMTGYLARYRSIRSASNQDLKLLEAAAGVSKPKSSGILPSIIGTK